MSSLQFMGAAGTVTGSRYLVRLVGHRNEGCFTLGVQQGELLQQGVGGRAHAAQEAEPARFRREFLDEAALEFDVALRDGPYRDLAAVAQGFHAGVAPQL
jgi:hypothetical protein